MAWGGWSEWSGAWRWRTEDDSDTAGPVEHSGIGKLLDDLHQDACSNICMSTTASESNFDHEHNIRLKVEGTSE